MHLKFISFIAGSAIILAVSGGQNTTLLDGATKTADLARPALASRR